MKIQMKILILLALSLGLASQGFGQARLGMDRAAYGVYDRAGNNSVEDYPFCRGRAYKPQWDKNINPSRGVFNWTELDEVLQLAYDQKQRIYMQVHVSYKNNNAPPAWIYDNGVEKVYGFESEVYPDWLDEDFQTYYSEMVASFGNHVRNEVPQHLRGLISFVRVDMGIHGDDRPYDNVSYIPAEYRITDEEWMQFKFFAFEAYKQAFQVGEGEKVPLMFKHTSPIKHKEEWDWVQNNIEFSYGIRYLGDVRGHHFTGSQLTTTQFKDLVVDSDVGLFSRNEMDRAWESPMAQINLPLYFYWTAVEQLHPGLSIWDITGSALRACYDEGFDFTFDFFNKWSAELVPATAGGGFCIFHEGLDASDTDKFPESTYGNASRSNMQRYINICNDPVYYERGARMDAPEFATEGQVTQHQGQTGYNDSGWEIVPGNYERFITQIDAEQTSIGLFRIRADSISDQANWHPYDRFARSFDAANGKDTMYFDINDDLIDSTNRQIRLSVIYLDRGAGSFELQYDATGNSQKSAFVVNKTNTDTWKTKSMVVSDGVFGNNGPKGADLMLLNVDGEDDIFHMLEVTKLADVEITKIGNGTVFARDGSTTYTDNEISATFMEGHRLELTAVADPGWEFSRWIGDFDEIRGNWARVFLSENTEIGAEFTYAGYASYTIINLRSGKKIKPEGYEQDVNIVLAPVEDNTNWTKWSKEFNEDSTHYYLKNLETEKYFQPNADTLGALMEQQPMSVESTLGQWSEIPGTEEGYVYLVNRQNGNYIRPTSHESDGLPLEMVGNGNIGKYTQWTFIPDLNGVMVTGVVINDCPSAEMQKGVTHLLSAEVLPANATKKNISWSSSDKAVAVVSAYGLVTALDEGDVSITANTADGGYTDVCNIKVLPIKVTSVSISECPAETLLVEDTHQLSFEVSPSHADNKTVSWSSSNEEVATVDTTGLVTALAAGTADITIQTEDGGFTATCTTHIVSPIISVTGVSISACPAWDIEQDSSFQLSASVSPEDATDTGVSWSSSDETVATVDQTGFVTTLGIGSAGIAVKTADGDYTDVCTINVITPSAVLEIGQARSGMEIYPNPVSEELTIKFTEVDNDRELKIFDAYGRIVYQAAAQALESKVDLQEIKAKGILLVQVISGIKIRSCTIIVIDAS